MLRENCAHYNPGRVRMMTVDRLCAKGASDQHVRRAVVHGSYVGGRAQTEDALQTSADGPGTISVARHPLQS